MSSNLQVRIVDRHYSKGLYYNQKVEIIDVVSLDQCVCQTDQGKLLEGVKQHMLETIIPKKMHSLVSGDGKGEIRKVISRNATEFTVTLQLLQNGETWTLDYDHACE